MATDDGAPKRAEASDPTTHYWHATYQAAVSGREPDASRELLDAAAWALESDQPMDPHVAKFLAESLRRLLGDDDRRDAFKLKRRAGRPSGRTLVRDVSLAAAMVLQFRANPPAPDKTAAASVVLDTIGVRWGLTPSASLTGADSRDTIINAYDELDGLRNWDTDLLEQLARQEPRDRQPEETR